MSRPAQSATLDRELALSNLGQLLLLRGVVERGVSLRTTLRGSSMAPFIRDGDVVTIAPLRDEEPRVGEMVAFIIPGTGRLAVHRVVARPTAGWLVRGDACHEADGIVGRCQILGRVVRVERRGRDVRLGLRVGASWIALLSRTGHLARLSTLLRLLRRAVPVLHRARNLRAYRAVASSVAPPERAIGDSARAWIAAWRIRR